MACCSPTAFSPNSAMLDSGHELLYWPIKGKNLGPALALELSGMGWKVGAGPGSKGTGELWEEWLEIKPTTPWGYLPNLAVPGGKTIGNELAILQYIARKHPAFGGETDSDFNTSQELLHQACTIPAQPYLHTNVHGAMRADTLYDHLP